MLVYAYAASQGDSALSSGVQKTSGGSCRVAGKPTRVPELREGSGVAASRTRPGVLWAHNDSADPVLVVLDEEGRATGRVRVSGAKVQDWEDIAVGPCQQGSCIYIGDIGDNPGRRSHVTVYRVPEPAAGETVTREAEVFHARYPDGAHDAESLFVTKGPRLFIVTKGDPGPIALYRFPENLRAGAVMELVRVGSPVAANADAKDRPTAADISADDRWVAVRTTGHVSFYAASDLTAGKWTESFRADLAPLDEPRGEGVTFGRDGSLFLVGEAGAFGGAGTFAGLACTFAR